MTFVKPRLRIKTEIEHDLALSRTHPLAHLVMICGDFNFGQREVNAFAKMLSERHYKQIVDKPTTYRGNGIDHFYHNISEIAKKVEFKLHKVYYSDHAAVCVIVK